MIQLKIRYYLKKYKMVTILIATIAIIMSCIVVFNKVVSNDLIWNSTTISIASTLFGAFIGGFFSLMGSVWVNTKQQRLSQNQKRMNEIYNPLYNELMTIQNEILVKNPFPRYVEYVKRPQTILPHPQYVEWKQMQLDSRWLEMPGCLSSQLQKLETAITRYCDVRFKTNEEITKIYNVVLGDNGLSPSTIKNIGDVIDKEVLLNSPYIYEKAAEIENRDEIDSLQKEKINEEIKQYCELNEVIIKTRMYYEEWMTIQHETIDMLEVLIRSVVIDYEH